MKTKKFKVAYIAEDYALPLLSDEYVRDTALFPHLVEFVEDDSQIFIVDEETGDAYKADEFFFQVNVESFVAIIADS